MKKKRAPFLVGILLGFGLLSATFSPTAQAEDTLNYRNMLNTGQTISGTLASEEEIAIYPFSTSEPEEVVIVMENVRGSINVMLYTEDDQFLGSTYLQTDGTLLLNQFVERGNYTVRVARTYDEPSSNRAAFDMKVTFAAGAINHDSHYEPNDILKYGYPLKPATPIKGTLSSAADIDWYKIQSVEEGMVSVKLTDYSSGTYVSLHDTYGKQIEGMEVGGSYSYSNHTDTITAVVKAGTHYIRVTTIPYDENAKKTDYTLSSTFYAGPITKDANYEPNDIPSYAQELKSGVELRATTSDKADVDWYRFEMKEDGDAYISMNQVDGNMSFGIYDDLYYEKVVQQTGDASTSALQASLKKGTYYILVAPHDWEGRRMSGSYALKASFSAGTPVYDKFMEPNDIRELAFPLLHSRTYKAELSHAADVDWYKVVLTKAGRLTTDIRLNSGDAALEIFNANGSSIGESDTEDSELSVYVDLNAGTHYIRISNASSRFKSTGYELQVSYPGNNKIPVQVNGSSVAVQPLYVNYSLYFPANQIASSYGAKITHDTKSNTVFIRKDGVLYKIGLSTKVVKVNGKKIHLDAPILKSNSQILLPASFLTKVFNSNIAWDNNNQILITK